MIEVAVYDETDRIPRALVASWFGGLPVLSWLLRRTGQTTGHPDDSVRLLRAGELVLVFPEGVRGTGKPFSERYHLRRFGRGGFVERFLSAAGDDDLIAEAMESFRQAASDSGAAAGDEDCVISQLHDGST